MTLSHILLKRRLLKQPRYLYRYSSLKDDSEHQDLRLAQLIDTLKNTQLYCAAPGTFNDPFEAKPASSMEFDTSEFRDFYFKHGMANAKDIFTMVPDTEYELRALIQQEYEKLIADPKRIHSRFSNIGICCLSEEENNLLMWAHYTNGHNGYCLKFESPVWSITEPVIAYKVEYRKAYPTIDVAAYYSEVSKPFHKRNPVVTWEVNRAAAMIKSPHWNYEREWRLISPAPGYVKFNKDSLKQIALGVNVPDSVVDKIIMTIQNANLSIRVVRAELDTRAFRLNYVPFR